MNDILIDNEPISEKQLELLEPQEILIPMERPFIENIINNKNYFKNLQDVKKNSRNISFNEINRIENIDFEKEDIVYDADMVSYLSLNEFLEDEDNFYPTTGNSTPISRKILFVYKKSNKLEFSVKEKSQILNYVKTDMRREHIFFPCTSVLNQHYPTVNFNDTFYVKIDLAVPFFIEIYDFINMMTSTEGVFYLTPKLDNHGNQQNLSKTVSWGVAIETGNPEAAVGAKHCQDGSNISIYTYELCYESNFPALCKVSNRIKTRNRQARVDIINLLLTDEIYTRYLLNHNYDKLNEIDYYERYNENYIKEFKGILPVSRFDKTIIRIILNVLNDYYIKIQNSIQSYESRKEKRLNEQLNQALPYYTAKYILEQRKDEKNSNILDAKNTSRNTLKEIQREYIKDNPDLIFLNYYKNRIEKTFEILEEYKQNPDLREVNDFRVTLREFMDTAIFFKDINHGEKINQINSLIYKIDDIENIDATNNSQTRNIDYDDDGYFKDIKLDLIYLDTIDNTLNEINQHQTPQNNLRDQMIFHENAARRLFTTPQNNQHQTPQNNQYQTPQNNQYQTPQNNQHQTPQNNQYQTPQNNQYQTPQNNQHQTPQNNQYQTPQNNQYQTPQNNLRDRTIFSGNTPRRLWDDEEDSDDDMFQTPQNNQHQTPQNNLRYRLLFSENTPRRLWDDEEDSDDDTFLR